MKTTKVTRRSAPPSPSSRKAPLFKVKKSRVHGSGVFAARRIRKGTRVVEYIGDRISHDAADSRYEDKDPNDNHTFLFTVNSKIVIDAGVNGGPARFINHSCAPNCESVIQGKRVFIEAIKTIQPGEELAYDYQITRDPSDPPNVDQIYACRCGAEDCRGTMVEPRKPKRGRAKSKAKTRARRKR